MLAKILVHGHVSLVPVSSPSMRNFGPRRVCQHVQNMTFVQVQIDVLQ